MLVAAAICRCDAFAACFCALVGAGSRRCSSPLAAAIAVPADAVAPVLAAAVAAELLLPLSSAVPADACQLACLPFLLLAGCCCCMLLLSPWPSC